MPFISVVIPVYNVEHYLRRCVESLTAQTYDDYEIILVDDGSKDNSGKICDELEKQFKRVRAVHKENGGLGSARNYGMRYVTGEYLAFVDSDDWVSDSFFHFLHMRLKKTQPDVLKFAYQRIQNGEPREILYPYYQEGLYSRKEIEEEILPGALGPIRLFDYSKVPLLSAWGSVYSVKFIREHHIFFQSERKILNEDYLFNAHVLLCADRLEVTYKVLYMYDYREGSLSKQYITDMLKRKKCLLGEYEKLLKQYHLFDVYKNAYYNRCVESFYACVANECCQWSDERTAVRNIREILSEGTCQKALKNCVHQGLSLKGSAIYWLMRMRAAGAIRILYQKMKRQKNGR